MVQITDQVIDLINDRIQRMDEDQISKVWDAFAKDQPAVVGYVLGESRELQEPDAREDTAYILTIILLCFRDSDCAISPVSEAVFEAAFNTEFDAMEEIFQEGFEETDAMTIMDSFNQPYLLQFP